jgi:hypothetical protein
MTGKSPLFLKAYVMRLGLPGSFIIIFPSHQLTAMVAHSWVLGIKEWKCLRGHFFDSTFTLVSKQLILVP